MEQASKFGDVKPVECLFYKLKIALHKRRPSNLNNVEEFCEDDWSKIPTEKFRSHIEVYKIGNIKETQVNINQVVRIFIDGFDQILRQVNVDRMLIDNSAQIFSYFSNMPVTFRIASLIRIKQNLNLLNGIAFTRITPICVLG